MDRPRRAYAGQLLRSVISDMTEVTDVCAFQAVLLLQFLAIASQIVHDRLDRGREASGSGCLCHAALCGLRVETRYRLRLSGGKCALSLVRLRILHTATSHAPYTQVPTLSSFEGSGLADTSVLILLGTCSALVCQRQDCVLVSVLWRYYSLAICTTTVRNQSVSMVENAWPST